MNNYYQYKKKKEEFRPQNYPLFPFSCLYGGTPAINKAWDIDYKGLEYSGTAVRTTTSSATVTSVFEEDPDYIDLWMETQKDIEKWQSKYCTNCHKIFKTSSDVCPKCGKKFILY